jgi:chromosome segregation ATPase
MVDAQELEPRVAALEGAQNETTQTLRWVVARLGRMSAVQDEHTLRLDRIDGRLDRIEGRLDRVESRLDRVESELVSLRTEVKTLSTGLPTMIADVMREVLKEHHSNN